MANLRPVDRLRFSLSLLVLLAALIAEVAVGALREFYVEHPLQAGIVSGLLLAAFAAFVIDALRANLHEKRWEPLSKLAFLSLAYRTTLIVDTCIWLATGQTPVNESAPKADIQQQLLNLRHDAGLGAPPKPRRIDLGHIQHDPYANDLRALVTYEEWRAFAVHQLDRAKWKNRDGIAVWVAAMLSTGESADVLNRLALLNEGVSNIQEDLRFSPTSVVEKWLAWHAEAVSIREDLVTAARGRLAVEWEGFRDALRPMDRDLIITRSKAASSTGVRSILAKPLR